MYDHDLNESIKEEEKENKFRPGQTISKQNKQAGLICAWHDQHHETIDSTPYLYIVYNIKRL